jgi:uncharacterized protein (UPF0548 family)
MTEKGELWNSAVSYAAIGATQATDFLRYPPPGFTAIERKARIGHGDARFEQATLAALTWKIQRNSGLAVELTPAPRAVREMTYIPVAFDNDGIPVQAATVQAPGEETFGPDGTPLLVPGDTAMLRIPFGPFTVKAPVRVVYVVDEPKRKGFAYGTLPGHPQNGEEMWVIDQKDDGSVWMTIRSFSRPSSAFWWLGYPVLRAVQDFYLRRYLRALAGSLD